MFLARRIRLLVLFMVRSRLRCILFHAFRRRFIRRMIMCINYMICLLLFLLLIILLRMLLPVIIIWLL